MMSPAPPPPSGRGFSADMEIIIVQQAAALAIAFAMGVALGFVYDLLRPFRRRASVWAAALIDTVFALISGIFVFIYAMAAPGGRLGLWELALCLLGFLAYIHILSDRIYALTDGSYKFCRHCFRIIKENVQKIHNMTKLFFQNVQE